MSDNKMKDTKQLLEKRNALKKRKPKFIRQESHKKKKLEQSWRKPKGMHSKLRRMLRGNRRVVQPGWGSPKEVKGTSKEGLKQNVIFNPSELSKLNSKIDGAIVSSTVGTKKKMEIIKKAKELGIKVLNWNVDKFLDNFEKMQKAREEKKAKTTKEKEEKQKENEKKAAEKEKKEKDEKKESQPEDSKSNDEKLEKKKELDKDLSKKDAA